MANSKKKDLSLAKMPFEEIQGLSPEKFKALMKAGEKAYYRELKDIGDPLYPGYTLEEKINFWAHTLNRQMRRQSESGLDEYLIYSPDWYKAIKRLEPAFDEIMDKVFEQPGFQEWRKEEYLKRIHRG